jgi:hypothetical protein
MKTKSKSITITSLNSWDEVKCMTYLANNWGLRGVNGTGITMDKDKRTLSHLREEVFSQMVYIIENGII